MRSWFTFAFTLHRDLLYYTVFWIVYQPSGICIWIVTNILCMLFILEEQIWVFHAFSVYAWFITCIDTCKHVVSLDCLLIWMIFVVFVRMVFDNGTKILPCILFQYYGYVYKWTWLSRCRTIKLKCIFHSYDFVYKWTWLSLCRTIRPECIFS